MQLSGGKKFLQGQFCHERGGRKGRGIDTRPPAAIIHTIMPRSRKTEVLVRRQIKLPAALDKALEELAAERGVSFSGLVRSLGAAALGDPTLDTTRPRGRPWPRKSA